ncbi:MAG: biotin/lipoyl-containing protein, partial [Actinomycetota bacterium]
KAGDAVIVLEAMKMENLIVCQRDGVIKELKVKAGATVPAGAQLAVIE